MSGLTRGSDLFSPSAEEQLFAAQLEQTIARRSAQLASLQKDYARSFADVFQEVFNLDISKFDYESLRDLDTKLAKKAQLRLLAASLPLAASVAVSIIFTAVASSSLVLMSLAIAFFVTIAFLFFGTALAPLGGMITMVLLPVFIKESGNAPLFLFGSVVYSMLPMAVYFLTSRESFFFLLLRRKLIGGLKDKYFPDEQLIKEAS